MSPVCRVCLAGNTRLRSLKNDLLMDVYEKLSSTQFNSVDARPRALCCYCYQKLLRCHTFSQTVIRSEHIFSLSVHGGIETIQKCISEDKLGMKEHLSISTMQFIALDGNTTDAVSRVTIKHEPIPSVDIKEEVTTEQDELVEVESVPEDCAKSQSTLEEDNSDQGNDVEELPSYSYVEQTKPNDSKMRFSCNDCNKIFLHKSQLVSHIKKMHFQVKRKQYSHTNQNTEKTQFVDKIVPKVRSQKKSFVCHVCDKQFKTKCSLNIHMRIHTGEKPFSCNVCVDKNFNQKSSLDRHMRFHTGKKSFNFACNICNIFFIQNLDLIRHMRIHTGDKPFGCKVCDKQFNRKEHLVGHMRIHTGARPFACNVCNKQFSRKYYVNTHMKTHRREKTFPCNVINNSIKNLF